MRMPSFCLLTIIFQITNLRPKITMIKPENDMPPPLGGRGGSFKALWSNNTPYSKLLITVGIILIGATLFTLISMLLSALLFGVGMEQLQTMLSDFDNPTSITILKFIQTLSTIG